MLDVDTAREGLELTTTRVRSSEQSTKPARPHSRHAAGRYCHCLMGCKRLAIIACRDCSTSLKLCPQKIQSGSAQERPTAIVGYRFPCVVPAEEPVAGPCAEDLKRTIYDHDVHIKTRGLRHRQKKLR